MHKCIRRTTHLRKWNFSIGVRSMCAVGAQGTAANVSDFVNRYAYTFDVRCLTVHNSHLPTQSSEAHAARRAAHHTLTLTVSHAQKTKSNTKKRTIQSVSLSLRTTAATPNDRVKINLFIFAFHFHLPMLIASRESLRHSNDATISTLFNFVFFLFTFGCACAPHEAT